MFNYCTTTMLLTEWTICSLGVKHLCYNDANAINATGYAESKNFKTAKKYKLQAVILGPEIANVFKRYADEMRPRVAGRTPIATDPLWLSYEGKKEEQMGRHITKFFQKHCQMQITTTTIRTVVETTSQILLNAGRSVHCAPAYLSTSRLRLLLLIA